MPLPSTIFRRLRRQVTPAGTTAMRVTFLPASENLTWTCHVCGRSRPDRKISVYNRRWVNPVGVSIHENVRYCNDDRSCANAAPTVTLATLSEEPDSEWQQRAN